MRRRVVVRWGQELLLPGALEVGGGELGAGGVCLQCRVRGGEWRSVRGVPCEPLVSGRERELCVRSEQQLGVWELVGGGVRLLGRVFWASGRAVRAVSGGHVLRGGRAERVPEQRVGGIRELECGGLPLSCGVLW